MKISACYIVKNEAENIVRSIASIRGQVDEIIVVDTGSTDDTLAVLNRLGAKVYEMPWQDDFSAVRNFALSKATGDWLILLDADEYFTETTRNNICQLLAMSEEYNGYLTPMVNYDLDKGQELDSFYQLRLVRNLPGLAYQGRVHEELRLAGQPIPKLAQVAAAVLQIYHTGYSEHLSQVKAQRNLALLTADMSEGRPESELYPYLCECYRGLGEEAKALHYAWLEVQQGRRPDNYAAKCHRILLTALAQQQTRTGLEQRLQVAQLAVEQFPELPDFYAELGEALAACYQFKDAIKAMEQAVSLLPEYRGLEPCLLPREAMPQLQERIKVWHNISKGKIKISACLIARNEADRLPAWLANVSAFTQEIIMVDTGSTDATRQLAAAAGAKVISQAWEEDFATARNRAIAEATGDWIVFIDADEYFYHPEAVQGYLQQLSQRDADKEAVFLPLDNIDLAEADKVIDATQVVRLFRRGQLHYAGRIHEQLSKNGVDDQGIEYAFAPAILGIKHTGYSSNLIENKLHRNLQLIQRAVQAGDDSRRYYYHLAQIYYGLSDYPQAIENAVQAIESPYQPVVKDNKMYQVIYNSLDYTQYPVQEKSIVRELQKMLFQEAEAAEQLVGQDMQAVLKDLAQQLQYLFVACLNSTIDRQSEIYRQYIHLLPTGVQQVVKVFHGAGEAEGRGYSFDSYLAFFDAVCQYGTDAVLSRYVALGKCFSEEQLALLAGRLVAQEKWLLALSLYGELPGTSPCVTDDFWFACGKCFYHLQEYASATECFMKALELTDVTHTMDYHERQAYLAWSQEKES